MSEIKVVPCPHECIYWVDEEGRKFHHEKCPANKGETRPPAYKIVLWQDFSVWILVNPSDESQAWSGSRWVPIGGDVQICNFASEQTARDYADAPKTSEPIEQAAPPRPKIYHNHPTGVPCVEGYCPVPPVKVTVGNLAAPAAIEQARPQSPVSILYPWITKLSLRYQGVLLAAIRGCDGRPKNDISKSLNRAMRNICLVPFDSRELAYEGFMSYDMAKWREDMTLFESAKDEYPVHYVMHMVNAISVVAYEHPDPFISGEFLWAYQLLAKGFHFHPESRDELKGRMERDRIAERKSKEHQAAKAAVRSTIEGTIMKEKTESAAAEPALERTQPTQDQVEVGWKPSEYQRGLDEAHKLIWQAAEREGFVLNPKGSDMGLPQEVNALIRCAKESARAVAVPEPAAQQECQFCGKPENNELHQADADLLKCSSHTRDDYHEFISKSEMRQAEPAPTPSRADELRQLLNVLARGKVRFSRNHGEPNPSPAFPYEAFFSYGDWQWITQLTQKLAEASALGTKEEKSV